MPFCKVLSLAVLLLASARSKRFRDQSAAYVPDEPLAVLSAKEL
jgi:hypothetical protein